MSLNLLRLRQDYSKSSPKWLLQIRCSQPQGTWITFDAQQVSSFPLFDFEFVSNNGFELFVENMLQKLLTAFLLKLVKPLLKELNNFTLKLPMLVLNWRLWKMLKFDNYDILYIYCFFFWVLCLSRLSISSCGELLQVTSELTYLVFLLFYSMEFSPLTELSIVWI
jgi:hypothetical protein